MQITLNSSSIGMPITDNTPVTKRPKVNMAESKMRSPLSKLISVSGQVDRYNSFSLSASKKKELGMNSKLTHASKGWDIVG